MEKSTMCQVKIYGKFMENRGKDSLYGKFYEDQMVILEFDCLVKSLQM